jgi:hypothetical protein
MAVSVIVLKIMPGQFANRPLLAVDRGDGVGAMGTGGGD